MSGTVARRPGSNVVPMPAGAPTPQMPLAAPMMWGSGGFPAGCCPPGGMDALLQCYCDVQSATAFISKVVQDLAANDPAFQQSLVDAIVASGSNIPLIGVTNGIDAQPGQVGEWVNLTATVAYGTASQSQPVTLGTLPPGDWDCWALGNPGGGINGVNFVLNPVPAGFTASLNTTAGVAGAAEFITMASSAVRALTSVPSLINFTLLTNTGGTGTAGSFGLYFMARRRR